MLLTATFCLLAFGAVMVYSASSARNLLSGNGDGTYYLARYVGYGALGLVAMHVLARRGLEITTRYAPLLLTVSFGLLVVVPAIGIQVNGARRWLGAGSLQFQPSELMKLALVLYTARYLARRPRSVRSFAGIRPILFVTGGACVLIVAEPDLGTAFAISATVLSLLVVAGVRMRMIGAVIGLALAAIVLLAIVEPYRAARLTAFLNPWAHAASSGFQAVQGQIALGSGGLLGVGLGQSVQKVFYLPEAHTDFILAVIGEELGVAGIAGVIMLYAMVAWAGLRAARAAAAPYAKLLATGLTALILCQATLNIFVVLGLAPLTGVPLPFISYGPTNLCVVLAAMGLLLNIAAGGSVRLRVVDGGEREPRPDRDRGRRDGRARRAGPRGGRRAAG